MIKQIDLRKFLQTVIPILALIIPTLAYGVITVRDPVSLSQPLSGATVIIIFEGEPEEAESDDDGILFWIRGSDRVLIDSLPAGTIVKLADGTELVWEVMAGSWWTPLKIGLAVTAGIVLIDQATDGGGGGSAPPAAEPEDPEPEPEDPPPETQPPADAILACDFSGLPSELTLETGDECSGSIGSFTAVNNVESGGSDANVEVEIVALSLVSVDPIMVTLGSEQPQTFDVAVQCDSPGTFSGSLEVTSDSGDPCPSFPLMVMVNDPPPPDAEPGQFFNSGPLDFSLVHNRGSSPCPDMIGQMSFFNNGGSPIVVTADFPIAWMTLGAPWTNAFTLTLEPGQTTDITVLFPCSGFALGSQTATIIVTSSDSEDSGIDTGGETYTFELTVN